MKEQPRRLVEHFRNSSFQHKVKRLQIPQKICVRKILRTRNCRRKFVKKILPEKTQRKHVNQTTKIQFAIELGKNIF